MVIKAKCDLCQGEGNVRDKNSDLLTICPKCDGKGIILVGKVIRVSKELFKRVSKFGVAGDSMATALENAIDLAERKRMTDEVNEYDNRHKAMVISAGGSYNG
jgi:hypothetical protein